MEASALGSRGKWRVAPPSAGSQSAALTSRGSAGSDTGLTVTMRTSVFSSATSGFIAFQGDKALGGQRLQRSRACDQRREKERLDETIFRLVEDQGLQPRLVEVLGISELLLELGAERLVGSPENVEQISDRDYVTELNLVAAV